MGDPSKERWHLPSDDEWLRRTVGLKDLLAKAEAERDAARAERDELLEALRAFMAKWAVVEPVIDGAMAMEFVHGNPYTGPTLKDELDTFRDLLAKVRPTERAIDGLRKCRQPALESCARGGSLAEG